MNTCIVQLLLYNRIKQRIALKKKSFTVKLFFESKCTAYNYCIKIDRLCHGESAEQISRTNHGARCFFVYRVWGLFRRKYLKHPIGCFFRFGYESVIRQ